MQKKRKLPRMNISRPKDRRKKKKYTMFRTIFPAKIQKVRYLSVRDKNRSLICIKYPAHEPSFSEMKILILVIANGKEVFSPVEYSVKPTRQVMLYLSSEEHGLGDVYAKYNWSIEV